MENPTTQPPVEPSETVAIPVRWPEPSRVGYTVYTKSGCPFCDKASTALQGVSFAKDVEWVNADPYLADPVSKEAFLRSIETFAGEKWRTFPMVFHEGRFVGGYTDLQTYLAKEAAFDTIDEMV
jgi:glutaredoxin